MGTWTPLAWAPGAYSTTVLVKSLATHRIPRLVKGAGSRAVQAARAIRRDGPLGALGPPEKALPAYSTTERPL